MNNRKKIEKKCKDENLTITSLFFFPIQSKKLKKKIKRAGDWILWVEEPVFTQNTGKVESHGVDILKTISIPVNKVDDFCKTNVSEFTYYD